jgi:hypothetical protein
VTGYLNWIKICFAELFERALDMYHSRQRITNFIAAGDNVIRSPNSRKVVATEDNGVDDVDVPSRPMLRVNFGEEGM